jgi:uncharacterized protein (TIGR02118 family)
LPAAVIKLMVVLYRRPDFDRDRFSAYLRDIHGPLAERIPDLLHYTQNFVAQDSTRPLPGWDAIVELWWRDRPTMEAAWRSPEGQAATADLAELADLERTTWSIVDSHLRR